MGYKSNEKTDRLAKQGVESDIQLKWKLECYTNKKVLSYAEL